MIKHLTRHGPLNSLTLSQFTEWSHFYSQFPLNSLNIYIFFPFPQISCSDLEKWTNFIITYWPKTLSTFTNSVNDHYWLKPVFVFHSWGDEESLSRNWQNLQHKTLTNIFGLLYKMLTWWEWQVRMPKKKNYINICSICFLVFYSAWTFVLGCCNSKYE